MVSRSPHSDPRLIGSRQEHVQIRYRASGLDSDPTECGRALGALVALFHRDRMSFARELNAHQWQDHELPARPCSLGTDLDEDVRAGNVRQATGDADIIAEASSGTGGEDDQT